MKRPAFRKEAIRASRSRSGNRRSRSAGWTVDVRAEYELSTFGHSVEPKGQFYIPVLRTQNPLK